VACRGLGRASHELLKVGDCVMVPGTVLPVNFVNFLVILRFKKVGNHGKF
jgi:hypothetical protein